ncbi:MAG: hypothetical protein R3321_15605, partial [Nitrososphaeraceae archaeon]|nr:hypothetical protein [Nitrososphaeraceae archaeon]
MMYDLTNYDEALRYANLKPENRTKAAIERDCRTLRELFDSHDILMKECDELLEDTDKFIDELDDEEIQEL